MSGDHAHPATESVHDLAAHQQTFRGFIRLLEFGGVASAIVVLLLYYFLAR
jgi:hypothetical protein